MRNSAHNIQVKPYHVRFHYYDFRHMVVHEANDVVGKDREEAANVVRSSHLDKLIYIEKIICLEDNPPEVKGKSAKSRYLLVGLALIVLLPRIMSMVKSLF